MILAADIGGTKTDVALFVEVEGVLQSVEEVRYPSRRYDSLEQILAEFVAAHPGVEVDAACFGVAGPVLDGVCNATNLPWHIDEQALAMSLGVPRLKLLNDVEAGAYGMLRLSPADLAVLNPGLKVDYRGNVAVVAAGTGLGEAMLYWDDVEHHVIASEGGHADFAPHTDREIALLRYLRQRYGGHVSYERVLSGPGLAAIYDFLRQSSGTVEPAWLRDELSSEDPGAVIVRTAVAGEDRVCVETVELFAHAYGVEAGNLALKCLARGGVFLGGGIAPRILPVLESGTFMRGFTDKGRFAPLLRDIRVSVALDPSTALLGAAHCAVKLIREGG